MKTSGKIGAVIAVSLMALTTYVIREGTEAKYHQPPVTKPVVKAVQVDPKASDEDQYWQFVQGKTDPDFLGSATQGEVVRVGQAFCAALEAHSNETARFLMESDPKVTLNSNGQWVIRGAARYLCWSEFSDVEAWYAEQ